MSGKEPRTTRSQTAAACPKKKKTLKRQRKDSSSEGSSSEDSEEGSEEEGSDAEGSEEGGSEEDGSEERDGKMMVMILEIRKTSRRQNQCQLMYNVQWMTEFSRTRLSLIILSALGQKLCVMECTSESLGAVLRAFCPCGLVRQALNYILRGVRIGAGRVKITLILRDAE